MAKKSRTPQPPRRVQAPKARKPEARPERRRRLLVYAGIAGAAVVLGAGAVAGVVLLGGEGADATLRAAGCTIVKQPAQEALHVEQLEEGYEYNTFPPSTGSHFPIPATWDLYSEPVEQFRLVHNLEHGGLIVQYGEDVPEATVAQIADWYRADPNAIVVAPLPELEDKVALGAWIAPEAGEGQGVVATCPTFDAAVFDAFKDEYAFRGPERFPRDGLLPGT